MAAAALVLLLALPLFAVELEAPFGTAAASGRDAGSGEIEISLSVEAPPGRSVIAHLVEPGGAQQTVAMAESEPGRYGGVHRIGPVDMAVVFELVGEATSPPRSLTALGLDRRLLVPEPVESPPLRQRRSTWAWLALAAAAAAGSVVALSRLGGRGGRGRYRA